MTSSADLAYKGLATNASIAFTILAPLNILLWLVPNIIPTRSQLSFALTIIYALAVTINILLPDLFAAVWAFVSAQPVCFEKAKTCYAGGGATWTDNFTLKNRLALVECNEAFHECYKAAGVGFFTRVLGWIV
jgi:hypothetical protein